MQNCVFDTVISVLKSKGRRENAHTQILQNISLEKKKNTGFQGRELDTQKIGVGGDFSLHTLLYLLNLEKM